MGIVIALTVICLWAAHLAYMLQFVEISPLNPWMYLHIIIQAYLYTGLFITGHDAMHGNISTSRRVNSLLGNIAVFLFAGMSYKRLRKNHGLHHKFVASEKDPDYLVQSQNFWKWWAMFMWRYLTVLQLIIMAVIFNLLVFFFPQWGETKILVFWALPALLGTLQLFYVGVYWPHRAPHTPEMGPHKARTQKKNHLWAMISCYFFGYHTEHHEDPHIPWWRLYQVKN
jgi:beta-carotene/zeaxanthin 4-ketolase